MENLLGVLLREHSHPLQSHPANSSRSRFLASLGCHCPDRDCSQLHRFQTQPRPMKPLLPLLATPLLIAACSTPPRYSSAPYKRLDHRTEYSIVDTPNGFTTSVIYREYQFIPRLSVVREEGKNALINIAYNEADARGRKIEPINEQRIRMSMGWNYLTGVKTWSGSAPAFYAH